MNKGLLIVLFSFILLLTGCFKNTETFEPDLLNGDINNLLSKLDNYSTSVVIDPTKETKVTTENNEVIIIPANSIVNNDEGLITGSVVLKYTILKNKLMDITRNRVSVYNNKNVTSLFSFELNLSQNNKPLKIAKDAQPITLNIPFKSLDNPSVPSLYTWDKSLTLSDENNSIRNSAIGYEVKLKNVGDFFAGIIKEYTKGHKICYKIPSHFTTKNTLFYAVNQENNQAFKLENDGVSFCAQNLPDDTIFTLVSISEVGGEYFVHKHKHKLTKDVELSGVPKKVNIEELKAILFSL